MVEKWKIALKEFLKKYEDNDDVVGAILCGSYATGNANENSDIDVYMVLKDDVNYQERGVVESNSYLIEYFMYPSSKIKEYMEDQHDVSRHVIANMFAYGKIIYDLDEEVKALQDLALQYLDKPIKSLSERELSLNNYRVWDYHDELKNNLNNDIEFMIIYYQLLGIILDTYYEFLELPKLPLTKSYKILSDEKYRTNYHVFKLPEDEFINLYLKCYELGKKEVMYRNINNIINYYYEKQGGFNIREFSVKENT